MAEQTSSSIQIAAEPGAVMAVIADFESYPEWAQGVQRATVVETNPGGQVRRVFFQLDAGPIKDDYTLEYEWDGDRSVAWHLVEGRMLRAMNGVYALEPIKAGLTQVVYQLEVDVSIPMIGMLKRKAEKVIIDTALKGLKKRVETDM